jgi:hypothetical protein
MRCTPERFWVFPGLIDSAYSYLLGLYLGDGCLASHRRCGGWDSNPTSAFKLRTSALRTDELVHLRHGLSTCTAPSPARGLTRTRFEGMTKLIAASHSAMTLG